MLFTNRLVILAPSMPVPNCLENHMLSNQAYYKKLPYTSKSEEAKK